MDDLKSKLDELVKNSDIFVASPSTIESMRKRGLPIKSTFQTYDDYLDVLFKKKRSEASMLIGQMPLLDETIANSAVNALFEEFKECYVLGINGAAITMAILLLDLAVKYKLYEVRKQRSPQAGWRSIEDMMLSEAIKELHQFEVINDGERKSLLEFNSKIRNNYLHYNIQKLVKDIIAAELPVVDVVTGQVTVEYNVKAYERPPLWFFAKKVLDKKTIVNRTTFCIQWVNRLLT